jgi:hypothetical protein
VGRSRDGGGCRGGHGSQVDVGFMFHEKVCFDFVTKSKSKFIRKFQDRFEFRIHPKVSKKFQD